MKHLKNNIIEIILGMFALVVGSLSAAYVYINGLTVVIADEASHLVFSRLVFDSMTPGISQIGSWPPLLHMLLSPLAIITPLFVSGLAGAVLLVPVLVAGVVVLYKLCYELTKSKLMSVVGALIYLLNPYVLYYSATPMMETLFITSLICCAFYLVKWLETSRLKYLIYTGFAVTLASLSRYEGLILLPVVFGAIVIKLIATKSNYFKIEATSIVFGLVALLGFGFILGYSYVFSGHPLAFIGIGKKVSWLLTDDPAVSITTGNLLISLKYLLSASFYNIGKYLVILSISCVLFALAIYHKNLKVLSTLLVLSAPVFAVLVLIFIGNTAIHVPELYPFGHFHNDRYSLSWILLVAISPVLIAATFKKLRLSLLSLVILGAALFLSGKQLYDIAYVQKFSSLKNSLSSVVFNTEPVENTGVNATLIRYIRDNYDYGKILSTRFNNDYLFLGAGTDLKNFVYEGNYRYFDQVLETPWKYARWVVMQNPSSMNSGAFRDPVKDAWASDPVFFYYYTEVFKDEERILYKIKDESVAEFAHDNGLDITKLPSVNAGVKTWSIYDNFSL